MADMVLTGRRDIFTATERLTADNVITEINNAIAYHLMNLAEEEYLYWYRRGLQPVLERTKERNTFVLNKVVENHAEEFCTFKNGYLLQEPASYISRREGSQRKVDTLNEYLYRSGKQSADNIVADWFHTVGKGALFVERTGDKDIPVKAYALDPRSAFVVKSMRPGNKPVFAVNMVVAGDRVLIDAFTDDEIFRLEGRDVGEKTTAYPDYAAMAWDLVEVEPNLLRHIPIIEYRYNSMNEACYEAAISLFDAINAAQSDRLDGMDQFIQSLAIGINIDFEEGVTAKQIREAGLLLIKSVGENKADFKILTEELNQDQSQTLVDNLYDQALRICAMPSTTKGGRSTSDTGQAVLFRDGWEQAASAARNTEDLFRDSNKYFDEIIIDVLKQEGILDIEITDFQLNFVRNETANVQSKAQAMNTMLASGLHPELALAKSGISSDPVSDMKMSKKYMEMIWGDPNKKEEAAQTASGFAEEEQASEGEALIVEEDNSNGEDAIGDA